MPNELRAVCVRAIGGGVSGCAIVERMLRKIVIMRGSQRRRRGRRLGVEGDNNSVDRASLINTTKP